MNRRGMNPLSRSRPRKCNGKGTSSLSMKIVYEEYIISELTNSNKSNLNLPLNNIISPYSLHHFHFVFGTFSMVLLQFVMWSMVRIMCITSKVHTFFCWWIVIILWFVCNRLIWIFWIVALQFFVSSVYSQIFLLQSIWHWVFAVSFWKSLEPGSRSCQYRGCCFGISFY